MPPQDAVASHTKANRAVKGRIDSRPEAGHADPISSNWLWIRPSLTEKEVSIRASLTASNWRKAKALDVVERETPQIRMGITM